MIATVATITALVCGFGLLLGWATRRFRPDADTLVEAIDALLPQTQCAQCGFPGCRPYAEAVADGAPANLCPPGGPDTHRALVRLLGREGQERTDPVTACEPVKAVIDEHECIGCFLCVQACPVDAIIGAPQFMHTVLESACTGCELCVPPCPVDCIELVVSAPAATRQPANRRRWPDAQAAPCIRCGACRDACPVGLSPQEMLWFGGAAASARESTARALSRCIECGLCNQVCPSNIDLVGQFQLDRGRLAEQKQAEHDAAEARERFARHQARARAIRSTRDARRNERIAARTRRSWQS